MKILIPTNNENGLLSAISGHFGKAKFYTLVTIGENGFASAESFENTKDKHSCGGSAKKVLSYEPDVLIVGGIGDNPARIFKQKGLDVKLDNGSKTVQEAIAAFNSGELKSIEQGSCNSH